MIHNKIRKQLILYCDGKLSQKESDIIKNHLSKCPTCRNELVVISKIWTYDKPIEKAIPSPYLWTRIEARISNIDKKTKNSLHEILIPVLRLSTTVALLIIGIIIGNYLGNIPTPNREDNRKIIFDKYFSETYHLDSFEPFPQESIGQVFVLAARSSESEPRR